MIKAGIHVASGGILIESEMSHIEMEKKAKE